MTDGPERRGLVLVVEDEAAIAEVERLYLRRDGFGVAVESTGEGALAAVRTMRPVAVLLDDGLPDIRGTEVCRRLRAAGDWTPVLLVTAHDDEVDRVLGLQLGADDYVTKPFSPRELVARVHAVLRRTHGVPATELTLGPVRVEPARRRARVTDPDGTSHELALTATEFDLLTHLLRSPDRAASREALLSAVWGYGAVSGTRTVDVHVAQLRAKLWRGRAPNRRTRLSVQLTLAMSAVVAFAVLVAAAVAVGLVRDAYDAQASAVLHRNAELVAELAGSGDAAATRPARPAGRLLSGSGVTVVRVRADGVVPRVPATFVAAPVALDAADRAAVAAGSSLAVTRTLDGTRYLLATAPVLTSGGASVFTVTLPQVVGAPTAR